MFRKQVVDLEHIEKLADAVASASGNSESLEAQLTAQLEQQEREATRGAASQEGSPERKGSNVGAGAAPLKAPSMELISSTLSELGGPYGQVGKRRAAELKGYKGSSGSE